MITFEQTRNLIIELNLPHTILELYDGTCQVGTLQDAFQDPYAIFTLSKEGQERYRTDRYKPFLAQYFEQIYAYDIISKKYVKYNIESFDGKTILEPMSWDSLFVDDIVMWWENELSDDEIMNYGKLLGIKNARKIVDERIKAEGTFSDFSAFLKWEKSLIKIIDVTIQSPLSPKIKSRQTGPTY